MKKKISAVLFLGAILPLCAQVPTMPFGTSPATSATPAPENAGTALPGQIAAPAFKSKYRIRREFAEVICAEISAKEKPEIINQNPLDDSPFKDKTCWAQIIATLPAGRSLSRFDFSLKYGTELYPCIAVAVGDSFYSMKKENWTLPKDRDVKEPVRMLFALHAGVAMGKDGKSLIPLKIVRNFTDTKTVIPEDEIPFRLMPGGKEMTSVGEAKKRPEGTCDLTYEELIKPVAPAPAPTEAAPAENTAAEAKTPAPEAKPEEVKTPAPEAKPEEKAPAPVPAKPAAAAPSFIKF